MSLGLAYPIRFVTGYAVAVLVYIALAALAQEFPSNSFLKAVTENQALFILAVGTLTAFGKTLVRPMVGSDNVSAWLEAIEFTLDRANLSKLQRNLIWQRVASKLVESIDLKRELSRERLQSSAEEVIKESAAQDGGEPPAPES